MTHGETTRERIMKAGVKLWPNVTLTSISRELGLTHAAISYHFRSDELKDRVARYAVIKGESRVIVQLISEKHPAIKYMSEGEKASHFFNV